MLFKRHFKEMNKEATDWENIYLQNTFLDKCQRYMKNSNNLIIKGQFSFKMGLSVWGSTTLF